jgi:hypothetical protein
MKRLTLLAVLVGALVVASTASAYFAQDQLPATWHIHNDGTCSQCAGHAFFPQILGETVATYLGDPAECPDATDKAFLGGGEPSPQNTGIEPNQPLREGICMTSTTVIHLKSIPADQPPPAGWTGPVGTPAVVNGITYVTYYSLTPAS